VGITSSAPSAPRPHDKIAPGQSLEDAFVSWSDVSVRAQEREATMKHIALATLALAASITFFPIGTAMAQSCESKAVSAEGKPLHGAAKNSFVKKCKKDACESKAVSAEGKPLHGAAKNSFLTKCKRDA
jgi:hypothetical protein